MGSRWDESIRDARGGKTAMQPFAFCQNSLTTCFILLTIVFLLCVSVWLVNALGFVVGGGGGGSNHCVMAA